MTNDAILRMCILSDIVLMAVLGMVYLRRRRMDLQSTVLWALITICLPMVGPFLLILIRPGTLHPDPFPTRQLRNNITKTLFAVLEQHTERHKFSAHGFGFLRSWLSGSQCVGKEESDNLFH